MIYGTLAYTLSFFILPPLWEWGERYGLHTQPDFFRQRFQSRPLVVMVTLIGVLSIIPYLQLQLAGLGLIVEVASGGAISSPAAIGLSFGLTCAFVLTSGLRGAAWVSVIKDVLMLLAVGIVGFGVPYIYFGGFGPMFRELAARFPGHLVLPGATGKLDVAWVMSTCVLTGLGFYMWPHFFGSIFSARSARIIRRNAIIMPLYQLPMLLVFLVGFAALLKLPGLKNGDLAFLELVRITYPAWFLGFVGAAGAITAMVPAAVLVLTAATLLAKNLYQSLLRPDAPDEAVLRLSRWMVLALMAVSLAFALALPNELVNLLILGYDGVCQLFPGVVLGLFWRRLSTAGVIAGLAAGVATVAGLLLTGNDPVLGLNAGFVALLVNFALVLTISLLNRKHHRPQAELTAPETSESR